MRGTVTDKFDRHRYMLRLKIDVTISCMNDLDAVRRLAEKMGLSVVLVLSGVSPYIRSRLIECRVDFVVPGSQLFTRSFLMSLRDRDSPPVSLSVLGAAEPYGTSGSDRRLVAARLGGAQHLWERLVGTGRPFARGRLLAHDRVSRRP